MSFASSCISPSHSIPPPRSDEEQNWPCRKKAALRLRSFFAARDSQERIQAARELAQGGAIPSSSLPLDEQGWHEVEWAFNRLFVGPGPVIASPYASVYLEPEPVLMGQSAISMRSLCHELGLALPHEGSMPEDHLALELEVWCILHVQLDAAREEWLRRGLEEALDWLEAHMQSWIPAFLAQAAHEPAPALIGSTLQCLEGWLAAGTLAADKNEKEEQ